MKDQAEAAPDAPASDSPMFNAEAVLRTCPNCGKALEEMKCKLRCPDTVCGYYLSCADYY